MAQFFRIGKSKTLCPATMDVRSFAGISMREFTCILPRGHEGDHVSGLVRLDDGKDWTLTWRNNTKFWEDMEKAAEGPAKRTLFLP